VQNLLKYFVLPTLQFFTFLLIQIYVESKYSRKLCSFYSNIEGFKSIVFVIPLLYFLDHKVYLKSLSFLTNQNCALKAVRLMYESGCAFSPRTNFM